MHQDAKNTLRMSLGPRAILDVVHTHPVDVISRGHGPRGTKFERFRKMALTTAKHPPGLP